MTYIMKLIERLRTDAIFDETTLGNEAADAIEALQGEVEQVKGFWKEAQLRNRNLLEESNDLAFLADQYKAERDALAAKLDELHRQEPIIDFTVLHQFASDQAISYNKLCTAVRMCLAAPKALEPLTDERKEAMAVYTPPFKYQHGYIFDSQQHMVADDDRVEEAVAARIRGWGKLSYLPNGAAIQDELGKTVADALTAYYAAHGITKGTP